MTATRNWFRVKCSYEKYKRLSVTGMNRAPRGVLDEAT